MPDDIEMDFENRIVAPEYTPEDVDTENPLRPNCLLYTSFVKICLFV